MFLSASQEYSSVQFRTLEIYSAADLREAIRSALDRGYTRGGDDFIVSGEVFILEDMWLRLFQKCFKFKS